MARVRDDVSRQSAELAARIPRHAEATSSIRVDEMLFVAAGKTCDNGSGALTNPVVAVADAAVVPDVAGMDDVPVAHAGLHAAVYRCAGSIREVITLECGGDGAAALGLADVLTDAVQADVRTVPVTTADPAVAVGESGGLLATAPLAVLAVPGFGVVISATASQPTVLAAAAAFEHLSSARPG